MHDPWDETTRKTAVPEQTHVRYSLASLRRSGRFGPAYIISGGKTTMSDEEKIRESTTEEISGGTFDPLNPNFVYCPRCKTAILKSRWNRAETGCRAS